MYRVGISGVRRLGPARMFELMDDCQLVAACDPDAQARGKMAEERPGIRVYRDLDAMLASGIDIVYVSTPMPLHAEQTVTALRAGCHVLCEVTLGSTIEHCRAIHDAVVAHPRQKFMMAENCCYWAYILAWRELWRKGLLGEFQYAEADYVHDLRSCLTGPDGKPTWRASRPAITYCSHSLGPILKVIGQRITSVVCLQTGNALTPDLPEHHDIMAALFTTSGGGIIKLLRAQAVAREPYYHWYSIQGTRGCLETTRPQHGPVRTHAWFQDVPHLDGMMAMPLGESVRDAPPEAAEGGHGTIEYLMVRDFVDSIRHDTTPPVDIYTALDMTLPGLCAAQSADLGGQPVAVPDWRPEGRAT